MLFELFMILLLFILLACLLLFIFLAPAEKKKKKIIPPLEPFMYSKLIKKKEKRFSKIRERLKTLNNMTFSSNKLSGKEIEKLERRPAGPPPPQDL